MHTHHSHVKAVPASEGPYHCNKRKHTGIHERRLGFDIADHHKPWSHCTQSQAGPRTARISHQTSVFVVKAGKRQGGSPLRELRRLSRNATGQPRLQRACAQLRETARASRVLLLQPSSIPESRPVRLSAPPSRKGRR